MSQKSVFCITSSRAQADQIADQLKAAGFSNNDISALFADTHSTHDFAHEKHTKAPEGAITGASTGGVIGGALGWIAGIGALAIPGIGPFIAAGPVMAALSGAAIGATFGGITGGLIGLGIPRSRPGATRASSRTATSSFPSTPRATLKSAARKTSSPWAGRRTSASPVKPPPQTTAPPPRSSPTRS